MMKSSRSLLNFSTRAYAKTMRAIVCDGVGGPEVLKVSDQVEIPEVKRNEVLLRVEATAVNRADTL
jgi:NADPH:quinone reductase-like Zn-dependent oxidoreductase